MSISRRLGITVPLKYDGISATYSVDVADLICNAGILPRVPSGVSVGSGVYPYSVSISGTTVLATWNAPPAANTTNDLTFYLLFEG